MSKSNKIEEYVPKEYLRIITDFLDLKSTYNYLSCCATFYSHIDLYFEKKIIHINNNNSSFFQNISLLNKIHNIKYEMCNTEHEIQYSRLIEFFKLIKNNTSINFIKIFYPFDDSIESRQDTGMKYFVDNLDHNNTIRTIYIYNWLGNEDNTSLEDLMEIINKKKERITLNLINPILSHSEKSCIVKCKNIDINFAIMLDEIKEEIMPSIKFNCLDDVEKIINSMDSIFKSWMYIHMFNFKRSSGYIDDAFIIMKPYPVFPDIPSLTFDELSQISNSSNKLQIKVEYQKCVHI